MVSHKINEIMSTGLITVKPSDSVQLAVDIMADNNISCLVVLDEDDAPVGIITERDLIRRILKPRKDPKKIKIGDLMTKNPVTIRSDATLKEGLSLIEQKGIRRLPVVDEGVLKGIVTQTDIVKKTKSISDYNNKLTFHQNLQSYIIIVLLILFIIAFVIRLFLSS